MPGVMNGKRIEGTIHMVVLYDPSGGRIVHQHRIVQLDPKQRVSKKRLEERAKEMATQHGWDVSQLKLLHVDHSKLKKGASYKVDPKSRTMVELPPPMPKIDDPLRMKR